MRTSSAAAAAAALAAAAVVAATASPAPAATAAGACGYDRHYLQDAVRASLFGIAGGRIALARAASPEVQSLASRLVSESTGALGTTARLAKRIGVAVPGNPDALQHWQLNVVSGLSGSAFDARYAWLESANLSVAVQDATEAARLGCSKQVRSHAAARAKLLRSELKLSTAAQRALKA